MLSYYEDLITRATYNSNAIEGNEYSLARTSAIILNCMEMKIPDISRESQEVINHKQAFDFMFNQMYEFSENNIINLAKILNKNINEIAGYRTTQVCLNGNEYIPPAPNTIKQKMMYFVHNYNNTEYDDIFTKIAQNHIEFERIHPLSDGNGRTGRLLIWYELLQNDLPISIITNECKLDYFKYIANQDVTSLAMMLKELSKHEADRIKFIENC